MVDVKQIKEIAKRAGAKILEHYHSDVSVNFKADTSPLTQADLDAHTEIIKGLQQYYPEIPVISEESKLPVFDERKNWPQFFLVDPLDGTKEFIKKNGEFTVNIALVKNSEPVLGVVYIPAEDLIYYATEKEGAFKQKSSQPPVQIQHSPYVKGNSAKIMVSRSHGGSDTKEKLAALGVNVSEEIPSGSSLKFCKVAEGTADLYPRFGPTMEWDTAAADAVFRYSGKNGARKSPLKYNKPDLKNGEFILGLDR
ncbi:MAG: 3'(2'),5'-bisphosphate nucleotidase CysQ [Balneolaceae bacterium]